MNKTIEILDRILWKLDNAYTHWIPIPPDYDEAVRVILADWNYTEKRVEKYGGFRWIFNRWWELLNADAPRKMEKTCVLGFDPESTVRDEEKGHMLLEQEGVVYLQVPPAQLQDIQDAVTILSEQPYPNLDSSMEQWVTERHFYAELQEYLHAFRNRIRFFSEGTKTANPEKYNMELSALRRIKEQYPDILTTMLVSLEDKIITYIEHAGQQSLKNVHRECQILEERIYQELK